MKVSASDVVEMWERNTSQIPAQFAVGLARRESGFDASEVDDYKTGIRVANPVAGGKYTVGLFQVSESELREVDGGDTSDYYITLQNPELNTRVFAKYMENRLSRLRMLPGVYESPDLWAYLALIHNAGFGMVEKTINQYGFDWAAFKSRNADTDQGKRWARYGDAAISGGSDWDKIEDTIEDAVASVTDAIEIEGEEVALLLLALGIGAALLWS